MLDSTSADMDEFLKMDVFFFVTTIAVVLVTVLFAFALWKLLRILKRIEHISEEASKEADALRADLAAMRAEIRSGKGRLKSFLHFLLTTRKRK
jgi:F0F1-type ATP synthase membrane subunit b/b'